MARLKGHSRDIEAVTFTPNGEFVVSASEDRSVRVWSVESGDELLRLYFGRDNSNYVGLTMDQQYFGDPEANFISIYVNGRLASDQRLRATLAYLGEAINITSD